MTWWRRGLFAGVLIVLPCLLITAVAFADGPLVSTHYQFVESTIGAGGLLQSSSANFQTSESLGDNVIGHSSSANFQLNGGSQTTADPALTFGITQPTVNFNSFSPTAATTATSAFSVIDYTSYGYAVLITGSPPTLGGHTIAAMASTGSSTPGTEQFGINLVANTSPATFGANPVQKPDATFSYGTTNSSTCSTITPGYGTTNQFKYVAGDTIAASCKSSGETDYTISYLVNVGSLTPAGQYSSNQQLICIGTY